MGALADCAEFRRKFVVALNCWEQRPKIAAEGYCGDLESPL
jgi:hypothetical protein